MYTKSTSLIFLSNNYQITYYNYTFTFTDWRHVYKNNEYYLFI